MSSLKSLHNDFQLGMSVAFSHGSLFALLFGMQVLQAKGVSGFLLWAIPNTICMAIFGLIYHKGWLNELALDNKIIKTLMIVYQFMFLFFQLNLLQQYFDPLVGYNNSIILASTISALFVLMVYKHGIITSIVTDEWQGTITIFTILLGAFYCFATNCPMAVLPTSNTPDYMWGLWSLCVYMAEMTSDLQQWRRADRDTSRKSFYWGSFVFFLLMCSVFLAGLYKIPNEIRLLFIIPVLGLSTSTIDSIAAALHECVNKKVGTVLALGLCAFWWLFIGKTSFFIWNSIGTIRIITALCVVGFTVWYFLKYKKEK